MLSLIIEVEMNFSFFLLLVFNTSLNVTTENVHYPVVFWHGLGFGCCDEVSMDIINEIFSVNPNVKYIRSIQIGCTQTMEALNSFFMDAFTQVRKACEIIQSDKHLEGGYNAIGVSQGGLMMRAVAQMCPHPPMKKLISLGGPQMGTYGIPECDDEELLEEVPFIKEWCERLLRWTTEDRKYRSILVPMQYWNSPFPEHASVKRNNSFLMKINNSYRIKKEEYKTNLAKLELLVLVSYENEEVIKPKESTMFGTYAPGTTKKVLTMVETDLYKKDQIGLKSLHEQNKIHFIEVEGSSHTIHPDGWLAKHIYIPYL